MSMTNQRDEIALVLKQAQRILITTHVKPDGDALGCQLALGDVLQGMGKECLLYSEEPAPYLYDFLPGAERLVTVLPSDGNRFDCTLALDCGDASRLGKGKDTLLGMHPFLVIDHHAGHVPFGDIRWVEPERAACAEMVYSLMEALGASISQAAACCLYVGLVTDTGSFRYSATTAETLEIAAALVRLGVKPASVCDRLFDNFTTNRLRLLQRVLASITLHGIAQQIAIIRVLRKDFETTGALEEDTENFINYVRALESVKIAVFLKETLEGTVAVSLRSKGTFWDVARVAAIFGGGGHKNAAGYRVSGKKLEEVERMLLSELLVLESP